MICHTCKFFDEPCDVIARITEIANTYLIEMNLNINGCVAYEYNKERVK